MPPVKVVGVVLRPPPNWLTRRTPLARPADAGGLALLGGGRLLRDRQAEGGERAVAADLGERRAVHGEAVVRGEALGREAEGHGVGEEGQGRPRECPMQSISPTMAGETPPNSFARSAIPIQSMSGGTDGKTERSVLRRRFRKERIGRLTTRCTP